MWKWICTIALFCYSSVAATAATQTDSLPSINGMWSGVITQFEGGYRSEYKFELTLKQNGEKVEGRSFVSVDDIFVEMEVVGEFHSGIYLRLTDQHPKDFKILPGMEWCMKRYQLIFKIEGETARLDGYWQGDTTFSSCIPGKVFLKRKEPRA